MTKLVLPMLYDDFKVKLGDGDQSSF